MMVQWVDHLRRILSLFQRKDVLLQTVSINKSYYINPGSRTFIDPVLEHEFCIANEQDRLHHARLSMLCFNLFYTLWHVIAYVVPLPIIDAIETRNGLTLNATHWNDSFSVTYRPEPFRFECIVCIVLTLPVFVYSFMQPRASVGNAADLCVLVFLIWFLIIGIRSLLDEYKTTMQETEQQVIWVEHLLLTNKLTRNVLDSLVVSLLAYRVGSFVQLVTVLLANVVGVLLCCFFRVKAEIPHDSMVFDARNSYVVHVTYVTLALNCILVYNAYHRDVYSRILFLLIRSDMIRSTKRLPHTQPIAQGTIQVNKGESNTPSDDGDHSGKEVDAGDVCVEHQLFKHMQETMSCGMEGDRISQLDPLTSDRLSASSQPMPIPESIAAIIRSQNESTANHHATPIYIEE